MLDERQHMLLRLIVEDYIQTAEPVGSKLLGQRHHLSLSSATIRSEMSSLEQEGFLRQPHPSSGRVPTEKAYLYYLQFVVNSSKSARTQKEFHANVTSDDSLEFTLRQLAKRLVDVSGETAITAIDPRFSYHVGVSNLLAKPDFDDRELLRSITVLIDQFDHVIEQIFPVIEDQTVVYIGSQNPFGSHMATIIVKYRIGTMTEGLIGLVGPLRMNYAQNIAFVEQAKELILDMYA